MKLLEEKESILSRKKNIIIGPESTGHACGTLSLSMDEAQQDTKLERQTEALNAKQRNLGLIW